MVVVTHNEIINAIVLAENVAYLNAKARNITLSNGETPCKADNDKAIEIEQWITILERAETQVENGCIDSKDVWNLIQKINKQYRDVDCDVSRTFSRNSSSGGNDNPPTGYVERVLGVNVNNSNPSRPVVTVFVDGVTITGRGIQGDPFIAVAGLSTVASVNGLTGIVVLTTTNITEGSNLYFTTARVLATVLSGLSITGGAITSSDTILQAFGKIQNQINGISTPSLQQVTDVSNTTTNEVRSSDGSLRASLGNGYLNISTPLGDGTIKATNLTSALIFELPNKGADDVFAMLSDLAAYVVANGAITGATKTKITYDAKGLVTSGADATTADIADSTNKRYVTDANLTDIGTISSKAPIASPTFTGTVTTPAIIISSETANTIAILDASKNIKSADTATYPSLTELAYGKGVTSAIQTQLDAKASKTFVENISLQDNGTSIAATTYTIELYAQYAYTINELKIIADAGTCTANLKIGATSVTGISAVSVSSTIATGTATAANTVAIGDKITLVTTSNSGLNNLQLSIKTTRI